MKNKKARKLVAEGLIHFLNNNLTAADIGLILSEKGISLEDVVTEVEIGVDTGSDILWIIVDEVTKFLTDKHLQ